MKPRFRAYYKKVEALMDSNLIFQTAFNDKNGLVYNSLTNQDVEVDFRLGIKDVNGKHYHFNDIVSCYKDGKHLGLGVLVWMDDCLGIASGEIGNYHAIDQVKKQELEESKIIGNIHETPLISNDPELLRVVK